MKKLLIILSLFATFAYGSECPQLYPEQIEVDETVELCNSFYVSLYDKQNQRVILVSERLKHIGLGSADRVNAFHSDSRIGKHPSPEQYKNTGLDKGHMAPAGDSSNSQEMYETFLMTNMTPQEPTLNRMSWKNLEEHVRQEVNNSKSDVYVVNIAVYGDNRKMNGIPVPTAYWKIVYIDGKTEYYYADNQVHAKVVQRPARPIGTLLPKGL